MKKLLTYLLTLIITFGMFTFMSSANNPYPYKYPKVDIGLNEAVLRTNEYNGTMSFNVAARLVISKKIQQPFEVFVHYTRDNSSEWITLPVVAYEDGAWNQDYFHNSYLTDGISGQYQESVTIQFKFECRTATGSIWDDNDGQLYTLSNKEGQECPAIVERIPVTIVENSVNDGIRYIYVVTKKDSAPENYQPRIGRYKQMYLPPYQYIAYYPFVFVGRPDYVKTYGDGYQLWEFKLPANQYTDDLFCVDYNQYLSWRMGSGF